MKPPKGKNKNELKVHEKFYKALNAASLLPRVSPSIRQKYLISRKQMYLIYLVYHSASLNLSKLSDYASTLNVSPSTLTRNIEKLEQRKILERTPSKTNTTLRLLSLGQLYAIEIEQYFSEVF